MTERLNTHTGVRKYCLKGLVKESEHGNDLHLLWRGAGCRIHTMYKVLFQVQVGGKDSLGVPNLASS